MKRTISKKSNTAKSINPIIKINPESNYNFSFNKSSPLKNPNSTKILQTEYESVTKLQLSPLKSGQDYNSKNSKNCKNNYSNKNDHYMGRVNSLQPFKKVDHEFYIEKTESNLWEKELQMIKTEKKIFTLKKLSNQNASNFGGVNMVKYILFYALLF